MYNYLPYRFSDEAYKVPSTGPIVLDPDGDPLPPSTNPNNPNTPAQLPSDPVSTPPYVPTATPPYVPPATTPTSNTPPPPPANTPPVVVDITDVPPATTQGTTAPGKSDKTMQYIGWGVGAWLLYKILK